MEEAHGQPGVVASHGALAFPLRYERATRRLSSGTRHSPSVRSLQKNSNSQVLLESLSLKCQMLAFPPTRGQQVVLGREIVHSF